MLTRSDFASVVNNAVAGLGFAPEIPKVTFPFNLFLVESDLRAVEQSFSKFIDGITHWEASPSTAAMGKANRIKVEGDDYETAYHNFNALFIKRQWGDGLPLIPPTEKRVGWILEGTDESPALEIGKFGPRGGMATLETLAVALAMAGGRPEYLPVLTAAVRAILQPPFNHPAWQATSSSTFPTVIVNGPAARQIHLNNGFGLLGPDSKHPAGGVIGRALRLLQQNVGGATPGVGTMAMFGMMRHTNAVFAEDDEGLPDGWEPFNAERFGYAPGTNSLAVNVCSSGSNIMRRGIGTETLEFEAKSSLLRIASYMRAMNVNCLEGWEHGTPGILVMSRTVAEQLASMGWTKKSISEFLWRQSRTPLADLEQAGMLVWFEREKIPLPYQDPWPITAKPANIAIVVAGGAHPTHAMWMQTSMTLQMAHEPIRLPNRWDELITRGDSA